MISGWAEKEGYLQYTTHASVDLARLFICNKTIYIYIYIGSLSVIRSTANGMVALVSRSLDAGRRTDIVISKIFPIHENAECRSQKIQSYRK